ncbi:IS5 family transposase [Sulfurovum sp. NBC37-1]|uniref:IS5 family transposase n=1 Tax=Sulfurovum sp. (strain NBC37-1) TaxID=387093 RepID=UPI00015877BA|nr:IS5 family transposase [Sulfurovum sp. NBC37-1]BAF71636.1 transposase [Sulfurovum sp. NBC37-1]
MQLSFFDHEMQYQGGKKSMKFLGEMKEIIPFDTLVSILIEEGVYRPEIGKKGGRPQTSAKILLGALFLQSWYSLSDPMTEELIHDRISFRKFLDITEEDTILDETIICKFKRKLIEKKLLSRIFDEVKEMMIQKNLIVNEGTLVDATLIHSPEPKRKKDDQGNVVSNVACGKEATYTSKRGQKHHGHKMHIATDTNGVIKKVIATTASTHDRTQFDTLTENETKAVFADVLKEVPLGCSGYMSQEHKRKLRQQGIFNGIVERRVRGQSKLRAKQQRNNKRFAKLRGLVELSFAFMKHHMNFKACRYLGLEKNQEHFHLIAACTNLRRVPKLMEAYG